VGNIDKQQRVNNEFWVSGVRCQVSEKTDDRGQKAEDREQKKEE
jgi:hypothetical protein